MFRAETLDDDGWTRRHVGRYGVLLRRNPEHIKRVIEAINRRYENDSGVVGMKELME